jgi:putative Holliday junction resolvase
LATLRARNGRPDADELAQLIGHWRPSALIVGLPLNMDDTESAMSARARSFATRLARTTGLPVHLVDERLSSREAQGRTRELQAHRARERAKPTRDGATTHARAAQLIAETYYSGGAIETVPSGRSGGQRR